jgi:hypothetical protein
MSDRKFSGGDNLAPGSMEHRAYEIMMKSELRNGRGAYEIGNAGAAASGPSFGPFQYDLGANQDGRRLLESIVKSATDAQGHRIISSQELEGIKSHLYKPFNTFTEADRTVYTHIKPKLNAALSSDVGVNAINADFVPGIQEKVAAMNAIVDGMTTEPNKTFVQNSDVAKLILIDTRNQYGKAVNDGLKEFVDRTKDDPAMNMPGRSAGTTIKVDGEFGLDDMIRYKLETQYGQSNQGAKDVLRRISHCIEAAGTDNARASLSAEEKTFLETGLEKYLKDHGRDAKILDDPQLKALSELGDREQHQTHSRTSHAHDGQSLQPPQPNLADATHPGNGMYLQALDAVHRLDAQHGRAPDQRSDNLAGTLATAAHHNGLTRIDHVLLSKDADRAFAVQGDLNSPLKRFIDVHVVQALDTPIAQSSVQWQRGIQQPAPVPVTPSMQQTQNPQADLPVMQR